MIRDVNLVSYLPPFLAEFKELALALEAENPEFNLIWEAADRLLFNQFIETADEFGISKFEKLLNILPSKEDTLETRRARIRVRWHDKTPYTIRALAARLAVLSNGADFSIENFPLSYLLQITTNLEAFGQADELERIIETIIPCNIVTVSNNNIYCEGNGNTFIAGGVSCSEFIFVTNDFNEDVISSGGAFGAAPVVSEIVGI